MNQTDDTRPYTSDIQPPATRDDRPPATEDGADSLMEAHRRRLSRGMIAGAALVVIAAGAWASFAEVQETVAAQGAVVPAGRVQPVQHLEGGVITEVDAKEGQLVEKGAPLLKLDPAQIRTRLQQAEIEEIALRLKSERLRAIGEGREPNFGFADPKFQDLVKDQWAVYNGYLRAQDNRRAILESRIDQRRADLKRLQDEDETLTRRAQILGEELAMREELFRKGLNPKIQLLTVKRQVADVRGALAELIARREKLNKVVEEAQSELQDIDSQARAEALAEMGVTSARLAQAADETKRLATRVAAFEIRSPVRGFVKGIERYAKGQVVPPGSTLLEVVPVDDQLIAEVHLAPRDVGRVSVGQPVAVEVTGAGPDRAGRVSGELKEVSVGTFTDGEGKPYYRATVALDQDFIGTDPGANRILPGMPVDIRVQTAKRTLLEYLFRPVTPPKKVL